MGVLREVVLKAPQLEEFAISATKASFKFFKEQVLPVLSNLRVLFVTSRYIVDLGEEEKDDEEEKEEEEDDYTDDGERLMNAIAQVAKDALVAVYRARQIFQINRMLVLTRAGHWPLHYAACYNHLFTCYPLAEKIEKNLTFFISRQMQTGILRPRTIKLLKCHKRTTQNLTESWRIQSSMQAPLGTNLTKFPKDDPIQFCVASAILPTICGFSG